MEHESTSEFSHHAPCPSPTCESTDAFAVYDDGHGHCYAHGCGFHTPAGTVGDSAQQISSEPAGDFVPREGTFSGGLPSRGLREETLKKFNYRLEAKAHHAMYYDKDGRPCAQKSRYPGKDFGWNGSAKKATLFGQQLWRDGGKMLVVTEGEIDAMAMAQAQGLKWPVVSVRNGAQGAVKCIGQNLEWVEAFDKVVFMFDNDTPGEEAARECAAILTPGKAAIASLPLKDAGEMLLAGREKEMLDAMWGAKVFRPDGILGGDELWDVVSAVPEASHFQYPWPCLNELTRGMRLGELVTITAGTGTGKSTMTRHIAAYLMAMQETVGYVALEESTRTTGLAMMSLYAKKPLHLPHDLNEDELREAFDATTGSGRFFLYNHFGESNIKSLLAKIRSLVRGCGCRWIILDHISIVVSANASDNERQMIDNTMTALRQLVEELHIGMFVVSHLRKAGQGKSYEEGEKISLAALRGSASIAQLSDIVIAAERNQQGTDKMVATLRVLKNRHTGETGDSGFVSYSLETGLLTECDGPSKLGGTNHDEDDLEF